MTLQQAIVSQFERPRGLAGHLAGWVMGLRPSNRKRNRWTVDLLGIEPDDRVLEIGCGPGFALAQCAASARRGSVVGVDHSVTRLVQARRRNRPSIGEGRLRLVHGELADLAPDEPRFNKVFGVNVVQFLPDLEAVNHTVIKRLTPGGSFALTLQPRGGTGCATDGAIWANRTVALFEASGFELVHVEELGSNPVAAWCVIGYAPGKVTAPGSH